VAKTLFTPSVIFENDDLIAVDKPAGVASIPGRGDKNSDLQHLLSLHVRKKLFAVLHLDKAMTGITIFAKNTESNKFLLDQFVDGKGQTFIALVHGVTKEKKGTIHTKIRKFGSGRMGADALRGMEAATRYEVMERFPAHTLVRINPLSDRRHQIRVHMFSLGHPIAGDPAYGDPKLQEGYPQILLHAHEISFLSAPGHKQHLTVPLSPAFTDVRARISH